MSKKRAKTQEPSQPEKSNLFQRVAAVLDQSLGNVLGLQALPCRDCIREPNSLPSRERIRFRSRNLAEALDGQLS